MIAGGAEILIVLVLVAVFFGAGKLPDVMGAMGKGYAEFDKGMAELDAAASDAEGDRDSEPERS